MREAPSAGSVGNLTHQGGGAGTIEDVEQLAFLTLAHSTEQIQIEVLPDDRCDREDLTSPLTEARHPSGDHLAHAARQGHLRQVPRPHPPAGVVLVDDSGLDQVQQLSSKPFKSIRCTPGSRRSAPRTSVSG